MSHRAQWQQMWNEFATLQVMRAAFADARELHALLAAATENPSADETRLNALVATLCARLWHDERSLREWIADRIVWGEHALAQALGKTGATRKTPPALEQAAMNELRVLQNIAERLPEAAAAIAKGVPFAWPPDSAQREPSHEATQQLLSAPDWAEALPQLRSLWARFGAGALGRYDAFRWSGASKSLEPVRHPDPVTLADLHGYATQREAVLDNTRQFVAGHTANNLLLYGDRGTGKSSLVKALRPEFAAAGLRLIEIAKEDVADLPLLLAKLTGRPARYVLFIDDLSFADGEDYRGLKAVLEGSLVARPGNVLVYATTNRRHLVHETRGERVAAGPDGEAAHAARLAQGAAAALNPRDVLQEKLSLADRFGKTIAFPAPDQQQFLDIVTHVARQRGIDMPELQLHEAALRWAQWHNGRSGRTARQFIDDLSGRLANRETTN